MVSDYSGIFKGAYKPEPPKTGFFYAYEHLRDGLKYFIGEKAGWLPEYRHIEDWLKDNHGKGLLCLGNYGRGKSVICRWILPIILNSRTFTDACRVMSAYELGRGEEPNWGRQWMVVDDIGVERETVSYGVKCVPLNEVVDTAEQYRRGLILTSNLTTGELESKYGKRTMDRLRDIMHLVTFSGESMRGKDGGGFPDRPRAYGVDFKTWAEAEAFRSEQDRFYQGIANGTMRVTDKDRMEVDEHQPLLLCKGWLGAMFKRDYEAIEKAK